MSLHIQTPLIYNSRLSNSTGLDVYLKLENLQPSGSFKIRGIGHYCSKQALAGAKGFVCSSGGNAGLAAAYAAGQLKLPILVVLPKTASTGVQEKLQALGATVQTYGRDWQEADRYTQEVCKSEGLCYVSPFDHPWIWEGHASIIQEVLSSDVRPDAIVLSVGGGGLLCGVLLGLEQQNLPLLPVYAVETHGAASLHASLQAKQLVSIPSIQTVARSLGARCVAKEAFMKSMQHPTHSLLVSDQEAIDASMQFAKEERMLVEPACGASLAACTKLSPALPEGSRLVVIVCGGSDMSYLSSSSSSIS